jgi:penicillin-binding protein 1A
VRRRRRGWLRFSVLFKLGVACLILYAGLGGVYYLLSLRYDLDRIGDMPERSVVYDRDGEFFSRFSGENRVVVPFDRVSNHFVNALIAREDTRFYQHLGVDPIGIARALARNLALGGIRQGGSTITQQLARNSFPLGGRNYHRKLLEAALSFRIETELTKERILECYMNRIYFGSGYYGIETACRAYFGKPASRIDLSESALLAGLIRSPTRLSPFNNLDEAITQRNVVLRRMYELGFITSAEMLEAVRSDVRIEPNRQPAAPQENWAMDTIRRELETILERNQMGGGGLSIYTSIDPGLQASAENAVRSRLESYERLPGFRHKTREESLATGSFDYLQAAAIAIDNLDGGIRMIVGGRDYDRSKFHRALLGRRQLGSVVKPFVYALAFERGLNPGQKIDDGPIKPGELPREFRNYQPANSDGIFGPMRPVGDGLIDSRNTMSVRVGMIAGLDRTADFLRRAGIHENPPRFPAMFLGAFESNLKNLTAAYTAFPNRGHSVDPWIIDRVEDASGSVVYQRKPVRRPLFPFDAAEQVSGWMAETLTRGTGASSRRLGLRRLAAGKTGTTNQFQDAWFVGFVSTLTCGVWVGFDMPKTILPGGGGSSLALPIWVDVMESPAGRRYP